MSLRSYGCFLEPSPPLCPCSPLRGSHPLASTRFHLAQLAPPPAPVHSQAPAHFPARPRIPAQAQSLVLAPTLVLLLVEALDLASCQAVVLWLEELPEGEPEPES